MDPTKGTEEEELEDCPTNCGCPSYISPLVTEMEKDTDMVTERPTPEGATGSCKAEEETWEAIYKVPLTFET